MMPWDIVINAVTTIIDKIFPDANAAAEAKLKLLEMTQKGELAQLQADLELAKGQVDVNKIEASGNWYQKGWRPSIGYVCVISLLWNFIGHPWMVWYVSIYHPEMHVPPRLDEGLFELVLGMLGLGAYRTFEKVKGVSK
jgi:hypothetical protein